jgi:hypothetical protein
MSEPTDKPEVPTPTPSPLELTRERNEQKKTELENEERELRIRDLKRPEYLRPTFWISVCAAIAGLVGIVGQYAVSTNKVERAELKAEREQLTAERKIAEAKEEAKLAEEKWRIASSASEASDKKAKIADKKMYESQGAQLTVWGRIDSARPLLEEVESRTQKLQLLAKENAPKQALDDEVTRLADAASAARAKLFRLRVDIQKNSPTLPAPVQRKISVTCAATERLQVFILTDLEWEAVLEQEQMLSNIMGNDTLLRRWTSKGGITPFEIELPSRKTYVFVSWGANGGTYGLAERIPIP